MVEKKSVSTSILIISEAQERGDVLQGLGGHSLLRFIGQ
jgi:stalled ribosome rescue protein Dom34